PRGAQGRRRVWRRLPPEPGRRLRGHPSPPASAGTARAGIMYPTRMLPRAALVLGPRVHENDSPTRLPALETARLTIRRFHADDLDPIHRILDVELANADFRNT